MLKTNSGLFVIFLLAFTKQIFFADPCRLVFHDL